MQFNTRVSSATYHSEMRFWTIETETGERAAARFLLQATGVLSEPYTPDFKNVGKFKGPTRHTSDWPREPVDLSNKRVGVIGTGATAVQMITEIAKDIGELTVFQRTPNYCKPLHNSAITQEEQVEIRQNYDEIFKRFENTFGGFSMAAMNVLRLMLMMKSAKIFTKDCGATKALHFGLVDFTIFLRTKKPMKRRVSSRAKKSAKESTIQRWRICLRQPTICLAPNANRWKVATTKPITGQMCI